MPLLHRAAFMRVTLEQLEEKINTDGVTETYRNSETQYGTKQSSTLQSYISVAKVYASVIKTLSGMLPPEQRPKVSPFQMKTPEERKREDDECIERAVRINAEIKDRDIRHRADLALAVDWQRLQREAEERGEAFPSLSVFRDQHLDEYIDRIRAKE